MHSRAIISYLFSKHSRYYGINNFITPSFVVLLLLLLLFGYPEPESNLVFMVLQISLIGLRTNVTSKYELWDGTNCLVQEQDIPVALWVGSDHSFRTCGMGI